jgi:hypothetical protein
MPSPSLGKPVPPLLQAALVPAMEEPTYRPAAAEVAELDAAVSNDYSGIEVFAPTVEPVSCVIEATRSARGRGLMQRMRAWLRRVA